MKIFSLFFVLILGSAFSEIGAQETAQKQDLKVYDKLRVIYLSDSDGNNERVLAEGYDPCLSPDQTRVAFVQRGDLYVIDIATNNEQLLLDNRKYWAAIDPERSRSVVQPFWSPDGEAIYFDFTSQYCGHF
jgi:Tol biopolymer transport system component